MLNIAQLLDRKPAQLSGGQRQRVAMGRAMVRDAGTFLFDEPLSNLDAKLRAKMRTELAEMRDKIDKNMVYVTHDQVEAKTLGDRIVVMSDGIIQQQGTPEKLFKKPLNRFVAGFIGSPTMNFLNATLSVENATPMVRGDGFALPLPDSALTTAPGQRAVHVGIRPSSFTTDNTGPSMTVRVKVSEYLGAQSVLVTQCGSQEILVETTSTRPIRSGTEVAFGVRTDELMLFDPETGLRL